LGDPILKKTITKWAGGVVQGLGREVKPQYYKKKNYLPCPKSYSMHAKKWTVLLGTSGSFLQFQLLGRQRSGRLYFKASPDKSETLSQKCSTHTKRVGKVAQVVE
jgi:hypothetical protein